MAWGNAVSAAGWGHFERPLVREDNTATVVIHNPWEMRMQQSLREQERWGCPFLQGKIIGIFRHALGVMNCWADEHLSMEEEGWRLELSVYPSEKTIETEIARLRRMRQQEREKALQALVDERTAELHEAQRALQRHSIELERRVEERTREAARGDPPRSGGRARQERVLGDDVP